MSTQRSARIRCDLPCELSLGRRRRAAATVTGLSDKGFSLGSDHAFVQGETQRVCILPHRGRRAVKVDAIVWSTRERVDRRDGKRHRETGFMLSDPTPEFSALVEEVRRRGNSASARPMNGLPGPAAPESTVPRSAASGRHSVEVEGVAPSDSALPRPRDPLPPPKPEEDDSLPRFRVRLKQRSGPRSRSAVIRARSEREAERRAQADLGEEWEVLEVRGLRD